jgi:hypothetical protein
LGTSALIISFLKKKIVKENIDFKNIPFVEMKNEK